MTDIEPAIRKALRPRIGNAERRTRYLLDAHAVAVAAAVAQVRKQDVDIRRIMAVDIDRIAAERDEARETAADLATVWDRERETMAAHIGALEGELGRAKGELRELAVERNRDRDQLSEARDGLERLTSEVNELRTELDAERETLEADEVTIRDLAAERDRLRHAWDEMTAGNERLEADRDHLTGYLTAAEKRIEELRAEFPPCPGCGCRAPDDPDQRECGCDAGCNDGENPPGVQVLMDERNRLQAEVDQLRADFTMHNDEREAAAQTPAPGARSAPRARRAARVGPGKGAEAQEAQESPQGHEGASAE